MKRSRNALGYQVIVLAGNNNNLQESGADEERKPLDYVQTDQDIVRSVMLDIANKSANGWDQVIQSLAQLAMLLIDTACSQAGWPRTSSKPAFIIRARCHCSDIAAAAAKKANRNNDGPMDKVAALGVDVLVRMFQVWEGMKPLLMPPPLNRVHPTVARPHSRRGPGADHFSHYISISCRYKLFRPVAENRIHLSSSY